MAVLLQIGAPSVARAQQPGAGLSLDEALAIAHQNNPAYRIQENGLQSIAWQQREAWANFVPTLSVSNTFGYTASGDRVFGDFTLGTQPAQYSSRYGISLSLGLSGSAFLQPGLVSAQAGATRARVEGSSAGLVEQVTRGYLEALEAEEQLARAIVEVGRTESYLEQAQVQEAVGSATPLDVRRAETQVGQAEVQVLQAEGRVVASRVALMQALGTSLPRGRGLDTEFSLFEPAFQIEELLRSAVANNPDIRATRNQASAARSQRRIAQTQYLPSLSLSASWSGSVFEPDDTSPLVANRLGQVSAQYQDCLQNNRIRDLLGDMPIDCSVFDVSNPVIAEALAAQVIRANEGFPFDYDPQPLSVSMTVSIPVFTGFSRQRQVEEAAVAADNSEQQIRAEELRVRAAVEQTVSQLRIAYQTALLQATLRETAVEELELAQGRFEFGLATSIEVVDAQTNLSQAETNEISAVYDFHISLATLETLVGTPLR